MGDFQLPGLRLDSRRIANPEIIRNHRPGPGHERIDAWGTVVGRVRALGGSGQWCGKERLEYLVSNLLKDSSSQPMPYFLVDLVGCSFLR